MIDIRLEKLVLRNYKGFYTGDDENGIEVTFDPNLTVFIGDNGSGKSAVLDAIALFLWKLRAKISEKSIYAYSEIPTSDLTWNKDVNNNDDVSRSILDIIFKLKNPPKDFVEVSRQEKKGENQTKFITEDVEITRSPEIGYQVYMEKNLPPSDITFPQWFNHSQNIEPIPDGDDERTLELAIEDITDKPVSMIESIPVMAYYGANSIHTNTTEIIDKGRENVVFDAYESALDANEFDYKAFHSWFFDEQLKDAMRRRKGISESSAKSKVKTPFVIEAIKGMFNDDESKFENLEMDFFRKPYELYITKKKSNQIDVEDLNNLEDVIKENKPLAFSQLSSGERTLIALVADLSRRLCLANPNDKNPLEGNGIVLIDEIDVHLHPKWQQKVVNKLREVFPNVQFVVTTHSPLVLSNLSDEKFKVYRLRNNQVEKFDKVRGMRLIEIFYNLYDTPARPQKIQSAIDELFDTIDNEEISKAQELLDNLKRILSHDDPAIIEAETSLKYMTV